MELDQSFKSEEESAHPYFEESSTLMDFLKYMLTLLEEGLFFSFASSFIVKVFSRGSQLVLWKSENHVIGGFWVTQTSLITLKPQKDALTKISVQELLYKDYRYCCCLVMNRRYKKQFGPILLKEYFDEHPTKVFITSALKGELMFNPKKMVHYFSGLGCHIFALNPNA